MEFEDYHISPNQLTITFDDGCTITDLPLFLSQHESFIKNMKEGKARNAYKNRLEKVKEQLKRK